MKALLFFSVVLVTSASAFVACSSPDVSQRIDSTGLVSGDTFKPVALMLNSRCGSLDCHGSKYRNMRLYGLYGQRLGAKDTPQTPGTTAAEVDADYQSLVSLEPEVMKQVVADKGKHPERLTFFRKGRGDEEHKGGRRIFDGDDADTCLRSWFTGTIAVDACAAASDEPIDTGTPADDAGAD